MSNEQCVPSPERFRFSIAHCSLLIAHFGRPVPGVLYAKRSFKRILSPPLEPSFCALRLLLRRGDHRPIVGAEGRGWERGQEHALRTVKIDHWIIRPAISHGD